MIDGAIRLLSLANQLASTTRRIRLHFDEGQAGTMGYLDRMGFFDFLDPRVEVIPEDPLFPEPLSPGRKPHAGGNCSDQQGCARQGLPTRLSDAVKEACQGRPDVEELGGAVWTIFAELIDNIFSHSDTQLDGYAALQVYQGGNKVSVAVSTAGAASWTRCVQHCGRDSRIGGPFRYGSARRSLSAWVVEARNRSRMRLEGLRGESHQV